MEKHVVFGLGLLALLTVGGGAQAQDPPAAPKARGAPATGVQGPAPTQESSGTPKGRGASMAAVQGQDPVGTWLTEGGESRVRFGRCGPTQPQLPCGTIVWAKEESKDDNNPDPSLRGRSIVGIPLITNIQPDPEGGWTAALYNPENGKTYTGKIRLKNTNLLEVSGCVLGGLICGSQTWSKVVDTARPGGT